MDSDGRRDNLLLPGLVALTLFGAYVAAQRGGFPSYDGGLMSDVAKRLVTHHTVSIDPRADTLRLQNGYSWYALGTSLIELPLTVVQQWFAPTKLTWVSLTNPLVLAACGALIVRIGRLLGWRWVVCVLAGLGFGLLTPAV